MTTTSKKTRALDPEKIYDLLLSARTADLGTLYFKDGRVIQGSLIFNHSKGTGRVINVDQELSLDFNVEELRDVKLSA